MVLRGVKNGAMIIDKSSRNLVVNGEKRNRTKLMRICEFILPSRDLSITVHRYDPSL